MPEVRLAPRGSSIRSVLFLALAVSVLPAASFAQSSRFVQVTSAQATVMSTLYLKRDVVMTPAQGTVFETLHTEGDRFANRSSNWYWVLLPRDAWGTQRVGWISGRDVEHVSPPEPPRPVAASSVDSPAVAAARPMPSPEAGVVAEAAPTPASAPSPPAIPEVVLNFSFGKSDLSDEAKSHLTGAVAKLNGNVQAVAISLEGHADATGPDAYNEKLGLARADAVKRYLAEQHQIPADKIKAVTFGESQPAAPNDTREGRAQNRRVVVKAN